ncbi:MAG: hypothetical protein ACQSGP_28320 [Frankia sp.]
MRGLGDVREVAAAEPGWGCGEVEVEVRQVDRPAPADGSLESGRGVVALGDGRCLALDRDRGTATFHGPGLTSDVLAHPYLGPAAIVFSRWHGREAFHGGAYVAGGQAWVLLGPRGAGKSSLLAALAARGGPVVTDDILVTDGSVAYAGPRCVDLRSVVPGTGSWTYPVRSGTRSRLRLPAVASRTPLGGWLFLRWGEELGLCPVPATEVLSRLAVRRARRELPSDPSVLLALAAKPAWELIRPRSWGALNRTCTLLGMLGSAEAVHAYTVHAHTAPGRPV